MKLLEPFTFFVDRSLGQTILVGRLQSAQIQTEAHDVHFAQDTPDADWLREVGRRGWVVLTKDKAIRRNALERDALVRANVACFMLGRGDLSADRMAQAFIVAMPRMTRALRRFHLALAASVNVAGGVSVLLAGGSLLAKPVHLK